MRIPDFTPYSHPDMHSLSPEETRLVNDCVREFSAQRSEYPVTAYECIWRSHGFANERLVLRLKSEICDLALKLDTQSSKTQRLSREFDLLTRLTTHFAKTPEAQVIRPIYLSDRDLFFVTEFVDRPTAVDVIYNSQDDRQVAQVYRRAGAWLQDLHCFQPAAQQPFWPQWMMERIRDSAQTLLPRVRSDYQQMMNIMRADAAHLRGQADLQVFSHGDFHGLNLILGQGAAIGLDFTEARDKLAVYDIVDFLKADVFRPGETDDIDRSGILRHNKQMFFRRYRHPINMDILDFCLRGRLLRDWLLLCQQDQTYSDFEQRKAQRLETRLKQALIGPLI